ncbi:hypothetical protein P5673_013094 [Acropora cervicornis]|uniref:Uncharacterized protein n=1 Tax=Acropora cervicornis TaxID=6130 RepID=A0AAD9QLA6_ACRCE|nr:hypothetical protein P5673_013094 [Acropora cervicornis]
MRFARFSVKKFVSDDFGKRVGAVCGRDERLLGIVKEEERYIQRGQLPRKINSDLSPPIEGEHKLTQSYDVVAPIAKQH